MGRSLFDVLDAEWQQLGQSATAKRALKAWPIDALSQFANPNALLMEIQRRDNLERSDELLRALVAHAAKDDLASRTALQVMMPAMRTLAWRYRFDGRRRDMQGSIVVETLDKIRNYPMERRPDRVAANIARDVQHVFWQSKQRIADVDFVDPTSLGSIQASPMSPGYEVGELVKEGLRAGNVSADEAALIFATRVLHEPIEELARRDGLQPQSLRQRRRRAEAKLEAVGVEL